MWQVWKLKRQGLFENHPRFPRRVNTEFVKVLEEEYGWEMRGLGARSRGDAGLRDGLLRCGCGLWC